MIRKMLLNRTNRVYLRKRRVVKEKASRILKLLLQKQNDIFNSNNIDIYELKKLQGLFHRYEQLNLLEL